MSFRKSILISICLVGVLLVFNIPTAKAVTVEELQTQISTLLAQIASLQQQLAQLQGGEVWCHTFNINLRYGDSGTEVKALQTALEKEGFRIAENEKLKSYFGDFTASAVVGFQEKYRAEILTPLGLKYGTGYVGPATRAKLNQLYGCKQPKPSITVISPNGGEKWIIGTTQPIKWSSNIVSILPITFDIYLVRGNICKPAPITQEIPNLSPCFSNITYYTLAKGVSGTSYNWQVGKDNQGNSIPAGDDYKVLIVNLPALAFDFSNAPFSIVAAGTPSITVISPNGGEKWLRGSTQTVRWTSSVIPSTNLVKITARHHAIDTPTPSTSYTEYILKEATPNDGSETINLGEYLNRAGLPEGIYSLQVKTSYNQVVYDDWSDSYFKIIDISAPSITVISPNGGETWAQGSTHNITWTSQDLTANDKVNIRIIDYSPSNYLNSTIIASNIVGNLGVYSWTIPANFTAGSNYIIQVIAPAYESCIRCYSDSSDNYFSIVAPGTPSITVISPNGGENWERGRTYDITWTSSGIDFVNIWLVDYRSKTCPPCYLGRDCPITEAARCGPVSKLIVSSILASVGRYSWTVPADLQTGSNYKIRIDNAIVSFPTLKLEADRLVPTTTITKYVADESNNYFSIVALFSTSNNILTAGFDDCTGKVFYRDTSGNPVGCPPGYIQQGSIHVGKAVYPCDSDVMYGKDYFGNYLKSGWMPFCSKDDSTKLVVSYDDCGLVTPTKCPLGYSPKKSFHIGTSSKCTDKAYWAGGSYDNKAIKSGWITFCAKNDDALLIENCPTGYQEKGFIKDYFKHAPDLKYCIK